MNLSKLYNIDESRTTTYTQKITVPESLKLYLDHIPLKDSLTITKDTTSVNSPYSYLDIITDGDPLPGQVYVEYRGEYDYVMARGVIIFNAANVGEDYIASYIPVASRIDADPINELIRFGNQYDENIWTKEELLETQRSTAEQTDTGTSDLNKGILVWENVKNRPGVVLNGTGSAGLMTPADKNKLDLFEHPKYIHAIGSIKIGDNYTNFSAYVQSYVSLINTKIAAGKSESVATSEADALYPGAAAQLEKYKADVMNQWGGYVEIASTDTITPNIKSDGTIEFNVNKDQVMADLSAFRDALRGSTDVDAHALNTDFTGKLTDNVYMNPSSENRYVTEADPRLYNQRDPNAHTHSSLEITGSDTVAFMQQNGGTYADGSLMFPEASTSLKEDLARRAYRYHKHNLNDIAGLEAVSTADGNLDLAALRGLSGGYYRPTVQTLDNGKGITLQFEPSTTDMETISDTWTITNGTDGATGADGNNGGYYVPFVDAEGNLSWEAKGFTDSVDIVDIPVVNIKGPQGETGANGTDGKDYGVDSDLLCKDIYTNWTIQGLDLEVNTSGLPIIAAGQAYLNKTKVTFATSHILDTDIVIDVERVDSTVTTALDVHYTFDNLETLSDETTLLSKLPLTYTINIEDKTTDDGYYQVTYTKKVYDEDSSAYVDEDVTLELTEMDSGISLDLGFDITLTFENAYDFASEKQISVTVKEKTTESLVLLGDISGNVFYKTGDEYLLPSTAISTQNAATYPLYLLKKVVIDDFQEENVDKFSGAYDLQTRFPKLSASSIGYGNKLMTFVDTDWETTDETTSTLTINRTLLIPTSMAYELVDGVNNVWESRAVTIQFSETYIKLIATTPFTGVLLCSYYKDA